MHACLFMGIAKYAKPVVEEPILKCRRGVLTVWRIEGMAY
jgi:hypothetical protein